MFQKEILCSQQRMVSYQNLDQIAMGVTSKRQIFKGGSARQKNCVKDEDEDEDNNDGVEYGVA